MLQVRITSQLSHKLNQTPLSPELLIQRFKAWKAGDEYSSYWFGQTKTERQLTHTHMAPVSEGEEKQAWDRYWKKNQAHKRRSDCYVLYAYDKLHGYLLIDVLFDPGAHALWKPQAKNQLHHYEIVADNFIYAGVIP
jgi:hypothetical protein